MGLAFWTWRVQLSHDIGSWVSIQSSLTDRCIPFPHNRLLAFLLDGIHEDLNRVRKKPYIEDEDCDGTNDEGDAITAWSHYLQRNRSIVVDLFQGQLRSTMTCRNEQPDGTCGCAVTST